MASRDGPAVFHFARHGETLIGHNDAAIAWLDGFGPQERRIVTWPALESRLSADGRVVVPTTSSPDVEQREYWRADGSVIVTSRIGVPHGDVTVLLTDVTADKQELRALRLFRSLAERIAEAPDLDTAVKAVLRTICRHADWQYAESWMPRPDGKALLPGPAWHIGRPELAELERLSQSMVFGAGEGLPGRVWAGRAGEHVDNVEIHTAQTFPRRDSVLAAGLRSVHGVPLLGTEGPVAVLVFASTTIRSRDRRIIEILDALAPQLSLALVRKQLSLRAAAATQRFADLLASAGDAIISIDTEQRIVLFNREAERIFGYSAKEMLGRPLDILLPSSARQLHRRHIGAFGDGVNARREMGGRSEIHGRRKDGSEFPAGASISRLTHDGEVIYTAVLRDLTELRAAQAAMIERERQLHAVIEVLPLGVSITRISDGTFLMANEQMARVLGVSREEIGRRSILDFYCHPEQRQSLVRALRNGQPSATAEVQVRAAGGEERWVAVNAALIEFEGEQAVLSAARDVTERNRTVTALRRSERSLAEAQRIARLGNWDWNVASNALRWSDEIYRICGLEPQEFGATYPAFLERVHPEDRAALEEAIRRALAYDEPYSFDHRIVRPDGTVRVVHEQAEILRDGRGRPISMIGTIQDITERKQTEAALQAAKQQAEAANRAKSLFLAHMSHELRTPLNAVIGFSEMIAGERLGPAGHPRYREYGRDIYDSGRLLLSIIDNILDLSRIEAGRLALQETEVDLGLAIAACLRLVRERAENTGIRLESDVPADLWVRGDERICKQMVLNLLTNAVKFTPGGGTVGISAGRDRTGGVCIAVSDTGIGMAVDSVEQARQPFVQLDASLSRRHGGVGLGLALTDSFVRLHGGEMSIASAPSQGTAVTIRFPPERTLPAASGTPTLK